MRSCIPGSLATRRPSSPDGCEEHRSGHRHAPLPQRPHRPVRLTRRVEPLGRFWARATTRVPDLATEALLAAAVAAALLVLVPALRRATRHVVTIAHEGAHGAVALAAGRRLSGIRLHSDTSGLTVSAGRPT